MTPSVPLRWRVPNPPSVFVGRAEVLDLLDAGIARGAVTVVAATGGLGKSALVQQLMAQRHPARRRRTLCVAMRPGDTVAQLGIEILRAISASRGEEAPELNALTSDPTAVLALIIDLAEEDDLWLVLEDLQYGEAESVDAWLGVLCAYARSSRWIVTMRRTPLSDRLHGQIVTLGGLDPEDLTEIAERCCPDLDADAVRGLVQAADGSPWSLRQSTAYGTAEANTVSSVHRAALRPKAIKLIAALGLLDQPLSRTTLEQVTAVPDDDVIDVLVSCGVLESTTDGYRLHDRTRESLAGPLIRRRDDGLVRRLGDALSVGEEHSEWVEALRLMLTNGQLVDAVQLIQRVGESLISAGYAPRLWQVLSSHGSAELTDFRLELAARLGTAEVISWAATQSAPAPSRSLFSWGVLAFLGGRPEVALEALDDFIAWVPAHQPAFVFQAALVRARVLLRVGRTEQAVTAFQALSPPNEESAALRDGFFCRALLSAGHFQQALTLARTLEAVCATLPMGMAQQVQSQRAIALSVAGYPNEAAACLAELAQRRTQSRVSAPVLMEERAAQTIMSIHGGDLGAGERLLNSFEAAEPFGSLRGVFLSIGRVALAVRTGQLTGLEAQLAELTHAARATHNSYNFQWVVCIREYLALIRSDPTPSAEWLRTDETLTGPQAEWYQRIKALRTQRLGLSGVAPKETSDPPLPEVQVYQEIIRAEGQLLEGATTHAVEHAANAVRLTRDHGLGTVAGDAYSALCCIFAACGQLEQLNVTAREYQALADRLPSEYHRRYAELFVSICDGVDPGVLMGTAVAHDVCPQAALLATALLTNGPGANLVDEHVIDGIRRWWSPIVIESLGPDLNENLWIIDQARSRLYLPGGRVVDLSRNALFVRLLSTLVAEGGECTIEHLAERVWDVDDYHPLRDDRRIRVGVRRLRGLLEDDASAPARLVTTEGGYALGSQLPCVFICKDTSSMS